MEEVCDQKEMKEDERTTSSIRRQLDLEKGGQISLGWTWSVEQRHRS